MSNPSIANATMRVQSAIELVQMVAALATKYGPVGLAAVEDIRKNIEDVVQMPEAELVALVAGKMKAMDAADDKVQARPTKPAPGTPSAPAS